MANKIEWNPEHKNSDEQELAFRLEYITWSAEKRWNYLMKLCGQGKQIDPKNRKKKLLWK